MFDALRVGISAALRDPDAVPKELSDAVRLVCLEARRESLRGEHLVVTFKDVWDAIPEIQAVPVGPRRTELLSRVISLCIRQYYSVERDTAAPG